MGIYGGMFLFVLLCYLVGISGGMVFYLTQEIGKSSGWKVFWLTLALFLFVVVAFGAIWIGGDQLSAGYHMYG